MAPRPLGNINENIEQNMVTTQKKKKSDSTCKKLVLVQQIVSINIFKVFKCNTLFDMGRHFIPYAQILIFKV